jgi:hypothetical protein
LPWRRFALDSSEKDEHESEEEVLSEWHRPKTVSSSKENQHSEDSDDDMLIVDKRKSPVKQIVIDDSDSEDDMKVVHSVAKRDDDNGINESNDNGRSPPQSNQILQEEDYSEDSISSIDITTIECKVFNNRMFYLNDDLSATDRIRLADHIKQMLGIVTKNPYKADYIIAKQGKSFPKNAKGEVVKEVWVRECYELQAFIPTARYKFTHS